MSQFLTEFPVAENFDSARFVAETQAWLKGNPNSTINSENALFELQNDSGNFLGERDESLAFRRLLTSDGMQAIGFRHDIPDPQGRTWRTEAVLVSNGSTGLRNILRIRTQCRAHAPGALVQEPKKPFFINALLSGNWGGLDRELTVSGSPNWLPDTDDGLALAANIMAGIGTDFLPVFYVSTDNFGRAVVDREQIERLAYKLGGIAHVIIEPNRGFSFKLKAAAGGRNAYAGAIGLALPGRGLVARYQAGLHFHDLGTLVATLTRAAVLAKSQTPLVGWDWTDLHERALRENTVTIRNSVNSDEINSVFDEMSRQIDELNDEKSALEAELASAKRERLTADSDNRVSSLFSDSSFLNEVYEGELNDRIRLAINIALSVADSRGLDGRSVAVFKSILSRLHSSPGLEELNEDISRSTRDLRRVADDVSELLSNHGYKRKSENKHVKLEPLSEFEGLESITLPKTPSEYRSLKNIASLVRRALGINAL